jgi:hypothetical protein
MTQPTRSPWETLRNIWIGFNEPMKNWPFIFRAYDEADRQQRMEQNQREMISLLKQLARRKR